MCEIVSYLVIFLIKQGKKKIKGVSLLFKCKSREKNPGLYALTDEQKCDTISESPDNMVLDGS